jgi:transposase
LRRFGEPAKRDACHGCIQEHLAGLDQTLVVPAHAPVTTQAARVSAILWHDDTGMSLYAKRLERGRFVWPQAKDGVVSLTPATLSMLLDHA